MNFQGVGENINYLDSFLMDYIFGRLNNVDFSFVVYGDFLDIMSLGFLNDLYMLDGINFNLLQYNVYDDGFLFLQFMEEFMFYV